MACEASSNTIVTSLEQWNAAKSGGQETEAANLERDIAAKLQREYVIMSADAGNSDPDRLKDMREKINVELARQSDVCGVPKIEIIEYNGKLQVMSGNKGFTVAIDETQGNLDGAEWAFKSRPPVQPDITTTYAPVADLGQPVMKSLDKAEARREAEEKKAAQNAPTPDSKLSGLDGGTVSGGQPKPADVQPPVQAQKPADVQPQPTVQVQKPADAQPQAKPADAQPQAKPADAQPQAKPADAQPQAKPTDAQAQKPADVQAQKPADKPAPKPHKPAPKYKPGERPVAGTDKASSEVPKLERRDYEDNMVYKYKDGAKVKWDKNAPPRVSDITNARGDRISLTYRGESKNPVSFIVSDKNGNLMESGFKGIHDKEWTIDTQFAKPHVAAAFKGARITDIGVSDDLQIVMKDKSGSFIERHRDGDVVKRDSRGRITTEVTPVGRTTKFTYAGKDASPSSYTIEGKHGEVVEHGEQKNHSWNVYRRQAGQESLDKNSLNNPANLVKDPVDKVKSIHVNHHTGDAVMTHPNGDRTGRYSSDERIWRRTTGGAETYTHSDYGTKELTHFKSTSGVKTWYEYDERGQVLKVTDQHPDGTVRRLKRSDVSQDFVNERGERQKIEAKHLPDGSVRINWLERNSMITQRPDGSELREFMAKDGRRRVHSTTDTTGTKTEFVYNHATGDPIRLTITDKKGQTDVWTIESPIKTGLDNPVWKNKDGSKTFEGVVTVERDGSVKFTSRDGKQQLRTLRGVNLDVTPAPTIIQ